MTDEGIFWARLDDPGSAVDALDVPTSGVMYLERVPNAWLSDAERRDGLRLIPFEPGVEFGRWERGRLFCDRFELRWERLEGAFQTVYVGEAIDLTGFAAAEEIDLSAAESVDREILLWGSAVARERLESVRVPDVEGFSAFVDFRISRLLRYPVGADAARVRLRMREYRDPASGERVYYRFLGLKEER